MSRSAQQIVTAPAPVLEDEPTGSLLAEALSSDGITLSPDDAAYLTRALLRLAELGLVVAADVTT